MTDPRGADVVLDLLSRMNAKLHVYNGRISGSLHTQHPTWTHVTFRGGKDETITATLDRAIAELHRRIIVGMPRTTQTAPCAARQWLCAEVPPRPAVDGRPRLDVVDRDRPAPYECPFCDRISFNPHDVAHRYCGACRRYHDS